MKPYHFLYLLFVITLFACSTSKNATVDQGPEFSYLEPISYIYYVGKKGEELLNDSLSLINRDLLDDVMSRYSSDRIHIESDSLHYLALSTIEAITDQIFSGIVPESITVPTGIYPVLDQSNKKYTIGLLSDGFVLDKKRYRKELIWSSLLTIVDEYGNTVVPVKHAAHIYCIVFNNEHKRIEAFEPIHHYSRSPTKPKIITKQVNTLVKRISKMNL